MKSLLKPPKRFLRDHIHTALPIFRVYTRSAIYVLPFIVTRTIEKYKDKIFSKGRKFYPLTVSAFKKEGDVAVALCKTDSGEGVSIAIDAVNGVLRLRAGDVKDSKTGDVLLELKKTHVEIKENGEYLQVSTGKISARLKRGHFQMSVLEDGRVKTAINGVSLVRDKKGKKGFLVSLSLGNDEHFYGFGEKFMNLDKRGTRMIAWSIDSLGNASERSYKNIPFFMSTSGYGAFINSSCRIIYEIGCEKKDEFSFMAEDSKLELFFIPSQDFKEILGKYTDMTGKAPVPPKWSFGLWVSRCMYTSRKQVEEVAAKMRELDIPCDVISIDPMWLKNRTRWIRDGCDFEWSEERFPDPKGMIKNLRNLGIRLCLWINPYIPRKTEMYKEGEKKSYFPKKKNGKPAACLDGPRFYPVDFSNKEAAEWYKSGLKMLLDMGVSAFKTDYGEGAPENAVYFNGMSGGEMHNLYPLLYNKAVFEATKEHNGKGIVWARSAFAGSQKYPVQWSGDAGSKFSTMRHVLIGGLGFGMSGVPFWSHDIGGFAGIPSPELYVRWAQFGLLSSHARFHGTTPREPWYFGEDATNIIRTYAKLRYRLIPYLYSYAHAASKTGLPLIRAMVLEFQDDEKTHTIDTQYMLGRELMICPVFERGATKRKIYLPAGKWVDFWNDDEFDGPTEIDYDAPIEKLPIFVRGDSIVPFGPEIKNAEEKTNSMTLDIYLYTRAEFKLLDDDGVVPLGEPQPSHREIEEITFSASKDGARIQLSISDSKKDYVAKFHNSIRPKKITFAGKEIKEVSQDVFSISSDGWCFDESAKLLSVKFRADKEVSILISA